MLALPVVKAPWKQPGYTPVFDRERCNDLMRRCMEASTLNEAAAIILTEAELVPATVAKPDKKTDKPSMGWKEYFLKLGKALAKGKAGLTIFNDKGNTKLPFTAFSALPFVTCPGMGACQGFCYSVRAWRYPGGFCRQLQNTLLLKFKRNEIAKAFRRIKLNRTFRLYVDGDFDSLTTIAFWMGLLAERPDLQAYGYSKSWALLMKYGKNHEWPANYMLNLSSGGRDQGVTIEDMMTLPITRNQFVAVEIECHPLKNGKPVKGNIGFARYDDPAYHTAVREAAKAAGYGKVFSCPGKCGECTTKGHACGSDRFRDTIIAIGVH